MLTQQKLQIYGQNLISVLDARVLELTTDTFSKNHSFGFRGHKNGYFQRKLKLHGLFCTITIIFLCFSISDKVVKS